MYYNIGNDINNYIFDIVIVIGHNIKFSYLISKIIGTKPIEEDSSILWNLELWSYETHEF